jgi:hypothetical protein
VPVTITKGPTRIGVAAQSHAIVDDAIAVVHVFPVGPVV